MKYFLTSMLVFMSLNGIAQPEAIKNKIARIYECNPYEFSYCYETKAYGLGYGLIEFANGSKYSVFPGGKGDAGAMMAGAMKAFLILQRRAPAHKHKYYRTDAFKASGYFGAGPVPQNSPVFYMTQMTEIEQK